MAKKEKSILEVGEDEARPLPEDYPVNAELVDQMAIDVAVNKKGQVWAFHDKPFPDYLEWVEYDVDDGRLVFVTKGGRINDLGIEIKPLMQRYLEKAQYIEAYLMKNEKVHDYAKVQLFVRKTLH